MPNHNARWSLYSQLIVEKSVQPCGFRIAVVTCFADVRFIGIKFELVSIRSTLPLDRGNLMGFPKLVRPLGKLKLFLVGHQI